MKLNKLQTNLKNHEVCILLIYSIIILFPVYLPTPLKHFINSVVGKFLLLGFALVMLCNTNILIGLMTIWVVLLLLKQSRPGIASVNNYTSRETRREYDRLASANQFPMTLEEEMVKKRVPSVHKSVNLKGASYKPVYESSYQITNL